jgi:outer membrane protein TolC
MKSLPMSCARTFHHFPPLAGTGALPCWAAAAPWCAHLYAARHASPRRLAAGGTQAAVNAQRWWQASATTPHRLIDEALRKNNDLAAATIKVRRAQLQAGLAEDAFVPALGASWDRAPASARWHRQTSRAAARIR